MALILPYAIKGAGTAEANSPGVTTGTADDVLFDSFYDTEGSGSTLPAGLGITWNAGTRKFTFAGAGTWLAHLAADVATHATADLMVYFLWAGAGAPYVGSARQRYPKVGLAAGSWGTVTPGIDISAPIVLLQTATLEIACSSDTAAWSPLSYVTLEFTRLA